jgi:hypothetical protein
VISIFYAYRDFKTSTTEVGHQGICSIGKFDDRVIQKPSIPFPKGILKHLFLAQLALVIE